MDACTIIAKNYLAPARVLAESYVRHHPGARFYVLIIDDVEGFVDETGEPFELVSPAELDIPQFQRMAVIYDVLELSTAVKPWLLRWMLARSGGEGTMYLDPDMRLYAPLDDVFALVRKHGLVLSPHNVEPMPRDGKRPNEQDILIAGAYNLGFIGIGSGEFADRLLDWWGVRLERDCIVDPERGFFVDQRWIDLVPGMTDSFHLLRDPGFNVAYWNLPSRTVSHRDGRWWVNGDVPLRLFHFSGYDPSRPELLSKHQNRIELAEYPDLARLCREYGAELKANGSEQVASLPYTFATTASGVPLDAVMRRLHRELELEGFDGSVFEPAGEAEFLAALTRPAELGGAHGITRYLAALYERRPDLQRAYPDLDGDDAEGFLGWVHVFGRNELPIADALLPPRPARLGSAGAPAVKYERPGPLGVNVAGYLMSELGVGEIARQAINALDLAGVATLPIGIRAPLSRQGHDFAHLPPNAHGFPVNLLCVNADALPAFAATVGEAFLHERYNIGWWWWEVSTFPERWHDAFEHVDEVWAGSAFVAEALGAIAPVPVVRIPTPVRRPDVTPMPRRALGLPEGFLFLFVYDFNSVFERKNPLGLAEAFLRAFPSPGRASLALKSINAEHHPAQHERLKAAVEDHPHVHLLDHYVSAVEKNQMIAACDCYVSLHRSEGFGITMAEAMLLGKPVIATGYSGNLDFMTAANSYPVDHTLRPVGDGAAPYPADGEWAEPDLDHAARLMRQVVADPGAAAARGRRAAQDVARTNSAAAAGAAMSDRLHTVHEGIRLPRTMRAGAAARQRAAGAEALLRSGSRTTGRGLAGKLRRAPRKVALRLMKPHTAYQRQVDDQLVSGLRNAADELVYVRDRHEELAQRELEFRASILYELRQLNTRVEHLEVTQLDARLQAADARIDDLAGQVSRLHSSADPYGLTALATGEPLPLDGDYPVAPPEPWSQVYNAAHARFVSMELDDAELLAAFREGAPLPPGFGCGFDERVVEFPWIASRPLGGRVLDAGSTLNHVHVLSRLRRRMDELHIVTLSPEDRSYPQMDVSYLYADLRELPMRDGTYDRAVSISTFEHIGLENEYYGSDVEAAEDPQRESRRALAEVSRVLRPGGDFYLTVPVGRGERFAWVRSFTPEELDELAAAFGGAEAERTYFHHTGGGWQRVGRDDVAGARYRDHFSSGAPGGDRVVAAEAVACLHLVKAG